MSKATLERAREWTERRRAEGLLERSGIGDKYVMYPASAPPPQAASWDGWPVEWNVPAWNGGSFPEYVFGRVATVFACSDLIGRSLASMPLQRTRGAELLAPVAWMANPQPEVYTSAGEWVRATVNSILIRGEAFVVASSRWENSGLPARFFTADPDRMVVDTDSDGLPTYETTNGVELDRRDVLHIRYQLWPGLAYRGIGPLTAAALNLYGAAAMTEYGANLAARGGVPWGALKHPANLSAQQADDLRERWLIAVADRRGAPAVLSGGIELEMFNLSPKEMSLLELRQWDEQRIAACFGVPPYLVGLPQPEGSLTYNNVSGLFDYFWRTTLRPLAQNIGDALSEWTFPPGTTISFDADDYIRPGLAERAQAYSVLVAANVLRPEEVRALENIPTPPDPDLLGVAHGGVS